jgi:hypothetical protein
MQYQSHNHRGDGEGDDPAPENTNQEVGNVSDEGPGTAAMIRPEDVEERALQLAMEEVWEESGRKYRPWGANGRATRMGEVVLLVDSDTVVPAVGFLLVLGNKLLMNFLRIVYEMRLER